MSDVIQSVQVVAASLTRKAADDLIAAARATPDEKVNWLPLEDSRPILEQLVECCLANRIWTNILKTHVHAFLPEGEAPAIYKQIDTLKKVIVYLRETSEQLAESILSVPDEDLTIIVPFPDAPTAGRPVAECCFHAYWNMSYHLGQVSYIQTLYGDWDEHGDIGPFGKRY